MIDSDSSHPFATPLPVAQHGTAPTVLAVTSGDGARSELLCVFPNAPWRQLLHWLPAMGVPVRHYLPLAHALAERGVAVVLHEWRGIGSSDRRAGRRSNWGYRSLLLDDLPPALAAVRARWPQARCWLGGHSLGGQLSALFAARHAVELCGLVLVASGAPYWRCYRYGRLLRVAYAAAPRLAQLCGYLPGRRIGFGGNEARALITDWARSGRTGRYAVDGMADDLESRMASLTLPVLAMRLADDWLAPAASLAWLLGKMPQAPRSCALIRADELRRERADHFGWMQAPAPIASRIAAWIDVPRGVGA